MSIDNVKIPVFSTKFVSAWGKHASPEDDPAALPMTEDMEFAPLVSVRDALEKEYSTDAHAAGYAPQGESGSFRINTDALRIEEVANSVRIQVAMIDLDRQPHEPWPNADAAITCVEALRNLFENAAIFTTRRGARLVFILSQPYDTATYGRVCMALIQHVQAIIEASGLDVEMDTTTTQWSRIFRMPKVVRDGTKTWEDKGFVLHIPREWSPLEVGSENWSDASVDPADAFTPGGIGVRPEPMEIPTDDWTQLILEMSEILARKGYNGLVGKLSKGQPFYDPGDRNSTTYKTLTVFLETFKEIKGGLPPAEVVFSAFYNSTAATKGQTDPETALDEMWEMLTRMLEAKSYVGDTEHKVLPQKSATSKWGKMPLLVYTPGRSRYIWDRNKEGFTEPIGNPTTLRARFHDLWGPTFQTPIKVPDVQILAQHGTYVERVVLDLAADRPSIDHGSNGKSLVLPVGQRVAVPPVYHKDVAEWLKHLGGSDHDGLLDWLHYSIQLDKPLCAIYLKGEGDAGKSMIATALSQFWGGLYVDFDEATSQFNGRLRNTPMVWLEESSSSGNTGRFRSLVGNAIHKVERKGLDPETLRGYIRMIITANNDNALDMSDVKTIQDVTAITQRVRYITVTEAPAKYLRDRGGRQLTDRWVTTPDHRPGALCEHIAWLAENHEPTQVGARFRVEGVATKWHYRAIYSGDVGSVLAVLAEKVAQNSPKPSARYLDGRLEVNTISFLADPVVRNRLKGENVGDQDARATLAELCTDEREDDTGVWSRVPTAILRDMPRTSFRDAKAYKIIKDLLK